MNIVPHGIAVPNENIKGILEAVKGKGLEYFVVDCGWFVEEGVHWSQDGETMFLQIACSQKVLQ